MSRNTSPSLKNEAVKATKAIEAQKSTLYEPLNKEKHEIRLLSLDPGQFDDIICCSIKKVSMNSMPDYEALSYTWGDPNSTKEIMLNERSFNVTENLASALRHLRYSTHSRTLWVDAICINQEDSLERSVQVTFMDVIYKSATLVVAWLGEASRDSNLAFDAFLEFPADKKTHWIWQNSPRLNVILSDPGYSFAIENLFKRPWFFRIWTIQESVLPETLFFLCGQRVISVKRLFEIYESWQEHSHSCCYGVREQAEHSSHLAIPMDHLCSFYQIRKNPPSSFQDILSEYRIHSCMNPRDQIYGLLGLASKKIRNLIVPDYCKPVSEVYEDVTLTLIKHYHNLAIFSQLYPQVLRLSRAVEIDLPSWVPDWTAKPDMSSCLAFQTRLMVNVGLEFRATEDSVPLIQNTEPGKITLRGLLLSSISAVGEPRLKMEKHDYSMIKLWRDLAGISEQPDRLYINTSSTTYYDAFWQTICCSMGINRDIPLIKERTSDHSFHRSLYKAWCEFYEIYNESYELLLASNKEFTENEIMSFDIEVNTATFLQRMIVSEGEQEWIGLASIDTRVGDIIALLAGGKIPYILRPKYGTEHEYEIIGDAYVHGVMDGGMWDPDHLVDITLV